MIRPMKKNRAMLLAASAALAAAGAGSMIFAQSYTPGPGTYTPPPVYAPPAYVPPPVPVPQPQPNPYANPYAPQPGYVTQAPPVPQVPQLNEAQIADLTAPIALYPDSLLAMVLPAATYPDDVAAANNWRNGHPYAQELEIMQLPFQDPVKALIHYPSVLGMMNSSLPWTQALGMAFLYQPQDVFNSVQRWRATAISVGTLVNTPEQRVVSQGGIIQILPAAPDEVYVPVYDPAVVYVRRWWWPDPGAIRFVGGGPTLWLDFNLDWHDRVVRVPVRHQWDRPDWDWHRADWDHHDNDPRHDGRSGPPSPPSSSWNDKGRVTNLPPRSSAPRSEAVPAPRTAAQPPQPKPTETRVFVRDSIKPNLVYPQKIVTPESHKVITPPPIPAQAPVVRPVPPTGSDQIAPADNRGRGRGDAPGQDRPRGGGNDRG